MPPFSHRCCAATHGWNAHRPGAEGNVSTHQAT